MRGLYLDCFSGISGDMMLGALVDLGVGIETLRAGLRTLPVRGYRLEAGRVTRAHIGATKVDVHVQPAGHEHRGIDDIKRILDRSRLPGRVRDNAMRAFDALVDAEARVHRVAREKVHLHEVGAVDAIVDIVGTMIGMDALGWPKVVCSPIHVGRGMVTMEHGTFPVPAPATAELLRGRPVYATELEGELATPTGAALAVTLAEEFGPMPPMRLRRAGHGAGTREIPHHPNILRILDGDLLDEAALRETVLVLETTIDDMNPQLYGHLMERLFAAGALEVFYTPIQMKKNRPGTLATIICPQPRLEAVSAVIFRETTTIGFRYTPMGRIELDRRIATVRTPYGPVRFKISIYNGEVVQATPEYEDCRKAALDKGVPLKEVQRAAVLALPDPASVLKRGTAAADAASSTRRSRGRSGRRPRTSGRRPTRRPAGTRPARRRRPR